MKKAIALVLGAALCLPAAAVAQQPVKKRPNFVILLADDWGFTDVGAFGGEMATPNLDALAANGVRFSNFHVAGSCSPTRAMLQTGVINHRAGLGNMPETIPPEHLGRPGYETHLNNRVVTIGDLLRAQGYRTYLTGKWHLGHTPDTLPTARGYDRALALSQSGADTFIVGLGGTPCPKTLSFVPETWKPTTIISVTCGSKTALALAGGKDQGVLMAQATLDPADATDAQTPQVKEFLAQGATGGLDQAQMEGGIASVGWGFGALFAKGLSATKTVDRAGIQNALFEVQKDGTFGLVRPDVDVKTDNATDPWLIEGFRIVERSGTNWTEKAPMQNWNGKSNSFAGN